MQLSDEQMKLITNALHDLLNNVLRNKGYWVDQEERGNKESTNEIREALYVQERYELVEVALKTLGVEIKDPGIDDVYKKHYAAELEMARTPA